MTTTQGNATRMYNIQTIRKFSTITIELAFLQAQDVVEMEARNLVARVLPQIVAAYPTKIATKSYFADLYAARVYSSVQRRGDKHEVSFQFVFTDPRLVGDENYQIDDMLTCIKRVLLEPYITEEMFIPSVVDLENQLLQARIINMEDDKAVYAQVQLLKHMFKGTPFSTRAYGRLENYPSLTAAKVYETYQKMLAEDSLMISIVGDVDVDILKNELEQMLVDTQGQSKPLEDTQRMVREDKAVQSFEEVQEVKQARLHIGYRIPATIHTADYFVHQVATEILGGGSQSKLFQHVREEASLAYSISATMDDFAQALYIYSGVDRDKVKEAQTIIQQQIQAMQNGAITDDELQFAKDNLLHRISMAQDNGFSLLRLLKKMGEFNAVSTFNDWKAALNVVTLEEVIAASKQWAEDTVFVLTGPEDKAERSEQ